MAIRCWVLACLTFAAAELRAADDPVVKLRAEIDKAAKAHAVATEKSAKTLYAAFDKEIEAVKKAKLKAEDRVKLIDSLRSDKEAFDEAGVIPFSPRMRTNTLVYLAEVQTPLRALAKSYDKLIDHFTTAGEMNAAKQTIVEKNKAIRKVIGVVTHKNCPPHELNVDGTIGDGQSTWSLDKKALVLRVGKYVDTCIVAEDGKSYLNTNNFGERCEGTLTKPKQ